MAAEEEGNFENTTPSSVILTDEKLFISHDDDDYKVIRQIESVKLDYVTRILVDPLYQYYCVLVSQQSRLNSNVILTNLVD